MTYMFEWIVPNRILKAVLPPTFDNATAQQFDLDVMPYLDNATQPIHLIMDMQGVTMHPSIKTLTDFKHTRHPHIDHILTIGLTANPVTRFISRMFTSIAGIRIKDVSSEAEALAYLERVSKKP